MYPELYSFPLSNGSEVPITTFGVSLTIAFFLFYWMLRRLGKRYSINTAFFSINLLSFFLTTFFVSRLLHVILYAGLPTKSAFLVEYPVLSFFLMSDFYFSAGGAILAFFGLFWFHMRQREKADREEALDITVIAWSFASIVAYLWAFLGGQVYGVHSDGIFAVDYINNPILAEFPRFPLAIVYILCTLAIFSLIYVIRKLRPERCLAASLGALLWGIMWFIGEWWNDASSDNISYLFGALSQWKILNFNQIIALWLIAWWSWRLAHIIPSPLSEWIIDIGDRVADILEDKFDITVKFIQKYNKKITKYMLSVQKRIKK
jgi:prolipoprotein diacylglyceryltransferase